MIYQKMCEATLAIVQKIHQHPFNVELAQGSLATEKFIYYLQQDSLYLAEFSRALAIAAARLSEGVHREKFIQFTLGAIQSEQMLHGQYLNPTQRQLPTINQSPTCLMYTSHLLNTVSLASIEEAVASLLPCFVIYHEVGKKMLAHQRQDHPYHDWIALYASDAFEASVREIISITNTLGSDASTSLQQKMVLAFTRSTQLEWLFWDKSYLQEQWPV